MDLKKILMLALAIVAVLPLSAQVDRKDVRAGNRMFKKNNFSQAEIDYRKALVKDSTSFAAAYDLASTLYIQKDYENAGAALDKVKEQAPVSVNGDSWYFNSGNVALQKKDYKAAVDAFKQALLRNPGDLEAKESYIYAKKMLENQDQNGEGEGGDNNQDQNQDQNNQNQQNQNNDRNQDQQQNQNQDQQQQQDQRQISAQQAQQMLKAIQAKEKETQEKVEKAKAEQAQTRRKEKNW